MLPGEREVGLHCCRGSQSLAGGSTEWLMRHRVGSCSLEPRSVSVVGAPSVEGKTRRKRCDEAGWAARGGVKTVTAAHRVRFLSDPFSLSAVACAAIGQALSAKANLLSSVADDLASVFDRMLRLLEAAGQE